MAADPIPVAALVANALEQLGIPYLIGGSVASSLYGLPRSTNDVDIVADVRLAHVQPLVQALGDTFMIDEAAVREAIARRSAFNLIHFDLIEKVDIFVLPAEPWAREQMARRRLDTLIGAEEGATAYYATAEDTILSKLAWYKLGHGVSDRQWRDVVEVIQVQGDKLDQPYLDRWAEPLGLTDLLGRARRDAAATG